ncbi:MAG: SDR family oxidoreductase [bacterium]
MDLKLKGRVALIGGASKGLGKGCALQLAKEGVAIAICANDRPSLDTTRKELADLGVSVLALEADMSSQTDNERIVKETLNKFGRIDILVNNSGGPPPGSFFDLKNEEWEKAFNSLLMYVVRLCRLVIPVMKENKWGRIINSTSLTVKEPAETLILSNVFRTGVISMAKSLSRELIKDNITINNICPGAFKTDRAIELMTNAAKKQNITVEEFEKNAVKDLPLRRYQEPKELGDLVTFLCSEQACGITGTTIQIDGGISKSLF